jgi:glutaminyl-tRNA synthetase
MRINSEAMFEPAFKDAKAGDSFQFVRHGYFTVDTDTASDRLLVNQTVSLKEGWVSKE